MGYTVIGGLKSRTARVLWVLEELGLDYEHIASAPRSDAVKEHNPAGKIPVLLDGDTALTDSTAIITYLADKHGGLTYPAGTLERARQDGLTHLILDEFDALLWTASRHSFILPEEHRVPGIKDSLRWEFQRSEKNLRARMDPDGPFLMGEKMTVPDILLAHCGGWAITAKFPITDPVIRDHIERMRARPAYLKIMGR